MNNLLVTEFVEGIKLSRLIALNLRIPLIFFRIGKTLSYIQRTASWLTEYEKLVDSTQMEPLSIILDGYLDYKIDEITIISKEDREALKRVITDFGAGFDKIPVFLTNTDFKIHNIILDTQATIGIDWEKMMEKGPVFWMLASFLRSLDNAKVSKLVPDKAVERHKQVFLARYWRETHYRAYEELYPLISALESITYLAESEPSRFHQPPELVQTLSIQRLRSFLVSHSR